MNYKMLRCIIQIILIIIFIVVNKVIFKKNLCINKKIILFEFIFMAFVYLYPIYLNYLKFDSLERAFSFYKPHKNIVQQYTIENFTYVIYETKYNSDVYCFEKKNNKWSLYIWNTFYSLNDWNTKHYYDYELSIKNGPNKNTKIVKLKYKENNEESKVYDSLNSKIFTLKSNNHNNDYVTQVIIVNNKDVKKYRIYVNDDIIKPFDFFNSKIEMHS